MSLEEIESGKSERLDLEELPDKMEDVKVESTTWETDRYGRNCLIVNYKQGETGFTQKYTPMHLGLLAQTMKELDIVDIRAFHGTLVKVSMRIGFDRMFPDAQDAVKSFAAKNKKR